MNDMLRGVFQGVRGTVFQKHGKGGKITTTVLAGEGDVDLRVATNRAGTCARDAAGVFGSVSPVTTFLSDLHDVYRTRYEAVSTLVAAQNIVVNGEKVTLTPLRAGRTITGTKPGIDIDLDQISKIA